MNDATSHPRAALAKLQLGGFVLDVGAGELRGPDQRLAGLRRQALELLLVLGRRAGQVVGKDELMELVWPDVVVGEGSITQAIAEVRRALGDTEHRLVRNVARRGYMLVPDTPADLPMLSIAVLPLTIDGDATDQQWFADALHGDVIAELSRLHGSLVIARDTAATYKGRAVDPRQVAHELRVRYVVTGSLRVEGSMMRLNLALVDGDTGVQRGSESFVVERAQWPQTLADLAVQIGRMLQPALYRAAAARRAALSPLEVSADDLAMRAAARWFLGMNRDNISEALKLLERAVALDADCLRGWVNLCTMNIQGLLNDWVPDRDAARKRIDQAAEHLRRLDSDGPGDLQARIIQSFLREDWGGMLRLTTAWAARHVHPVSCGTHGLAALLNGLPDEAVATLETALRLSPRDAMRGEWQYRLAMAHFMAERYEQACDWGQSAADSNPSLPWPPIHAAALQRLGQSTEARQAFEAHMARHPSFQAVQIAQRLPGGAAGLAEARERLMGSLNEIGMRSPTG